MPSRVKGSTFSTTKLFMSLVTPQNVKGFEKQMYEHNFSKKHIFTYPLIDHDKAYVHNRNRFIVSYGYQNIRSEEQLKLLQEALDKVGKDKLETLVYQRRSVKRQCHDVYLTYIVSEREVPLRNA